MLALVPAVCGFIGASVIGVVVPGTGLVRASLFDGFFGAIFGYVMAFAIVLMLALIIDLLAPSVRRPEGFRQRVQACGLFLYAGMARRDFSAAAGLALSDPARASTAPMCWLLGLPRLMKSPAQKSYGYAVVIVVCACALTLIAAAMQRTVFHTAGL